MTRLPLRASGLAAIAQLADFFLIDQYGVLHDGWSPYPGAVAALDDLAAQGKRIIILTNSGRRSDPNIERLVRLGFSRGSFAHVVSSGEVSWQGIRSHSFGSEYRPGMRVHVVGRSGEDYGLEGLYLSLVAQPEDADFILIVGTDAPHVSLSQYREQLRPAAAKGVPALCANPDKQMLTSSGLEAAPGAIAELYEQMGGSVVCTGKPYASIYRFALGLEPAGDVSRIIAIGDSVEHDIAGAARFGLRTVLVRTGILADLTEDELDELYVKHRTCPDYLLDRFAW